MKFREWVEREWKKPKTQLAKELGISYMHLYRLLRGDTEPKLKLVAKIFKLTNGKVTPLDLL